MTLLQKLLLSPFHDAAGEGTGGGAAATADPQTGGQNTGSNSGAQGGNSGSQAGSNNAAPSAQSTGFTYQEDRSDWIPRHRFNEVSKAAREAAQVRQELETTRRQLQAITGATPQDPNSANAEKVKTAFLEMFPEFKTLLQLKPEEVQRLRQLPEEVSRVTDAERREWARHGKAQLNSLYTELAGAIGTESLTDDQKSDVREGFKSWLGAKVNAELRQSAMQYGDEGADSPTLRKYEEGDTKELIAEYVKRHTANWVEPARRTVVRNDNSRIRPVPNSQGRGQVTSAKRPDKFNSLDERLDYAAKLFQERGGAFGR